jgi:hypothetical protein
MPRNALRCLLRWALAVICLSASINVTYAGSITRECAARDVQVLMLIEAHEIAGAAEEAAEALHMLMHARFVCHDGKVRDALALYDSIAQAMSASPAHMHR